jgi:flagella basal body P-ring formation protein FlgA
MKALIFGLAAVLTAAPAWPEEPVTIAVRPAATVDAARITLADVAAIAGGSRPLTERLAAIDLGPAPSPGAEKEVNREFLALRLRQEKVAPQAIAWAGAERTRVERKAERVAGTTIAQAAVEHVRKALPWPDEDLVVEVTRTPADLSLPSGAGEPSYTVTVPPGSRFLGALPCSVTITRGVRVVGRTSVVLTVRVFQRLVVARHKIRGGERITKDNVRLQRTELTSLTTEALTDLADALGQEARQDIQPFAAVTRAMVSAPRVIRRGAIVSLVADMPLVQIRARGIAQEDGVVGQWIAARNADSQRVVYGRVRDAETLEVRF